MVRAGGGCWEKTKTYHINTGQFFYFLLSDTKPWSHIDRCNLLHTFLSINLCPLGDSAEGGLRCFCYDATEDNGCH